jgi:hypothetical protein
LPANTSPPAVAVAPPDGRLSANGGVSHTTLRATGSHAFKRPVMPVLLVGFRFVAVMFGAKLMPRLKPPVAGL